MECSDQGCSTGKQDTLLSIQTKASVPSCSCSSAATGPEYISKTKDTGAGSIQTPAGIISRISTRLQVKDYLGVMMVRLGIRRDQYRVDPGLYAVGAPREYSDVLVTANYKLSCDTVRKNLHGLNVWLLVLDTKGVNVWCAAGKGTFGTKELVNRIRLTSLDKIVQHRRLILPQLGAVGVAAHRVKELSGYTVFYGPVRAADIPAFIRSGYKATKEMRRVHFGWVDRLKLVPNDATYNIRYLVLLFAIFTLLSGLNADGFSLRQASAHMKPLSFILAAGYISGIILTPLLLPYLFFKSFSFKGFLMGIVVSTIIVFSRIFETTVFFSFIIYFLTSGISSFLAMNFTGSSTFTSLAGVKKEMRTAVPLQIVSGVIAAILILMNTIYSAR